MENPKCPYCGEEMIPVAYGTTSLKRMNADWVSHNRSEQDTRYCFQCSICESESPLADTYEAAYTAAMKREKKRKTYFEDFLQKHPKADMLHIIPLTGRDVPNLCRAIIYGETMNCPVLGCTACWNEEMEGEDE